MSCIPPDEARFSCGKGGLFMELADGGVEVLEGGAQGVWERVWLW